MRILITGGGTGGHLAIAKALAQEFQKRGLSLLYVGSQSGQDRAWFEGSSLFEETIFLPTRGVVDKRGWTKLAALGQITKATATIVPHVRRSDAVVSVGGFSAAAASFGALLANRPLFIHEQNAYIGSLNRLLKPFARRFFSSFTPPYDPYPISLEYFKTARLRQNLKTFLFLGGSQGASAINDFALRIAPKLAQKGITIIHQTGSRDFARVQNAYRTMGIEADLFDFCHALHHKMARADFAISRAGASSAWELAANGLPTLFVPYPYAAGNHQYHNARFFVERGGALLAMQEELDEGIVEKIFALDLASMSRNIQATASAQGASAIVEEILLSV